MKCILFAGVVAAFFVFGEALHCYHTIGIDKPFNKNDLSIPCGDNPDRCGKLTRALKNGTTLEVRSCVGTSLQLTPEFRNVIDTYFIDPKSIAFDYRDICDTDNCNGSQSIIAIFLIILANLFISVFVSH